MLSLFQSPFCRRKTWPVRATRRAGATHTFPFFSAPPRVVPRCCCRVSLWSLAWRLFAACAPQSAARNRPRTLVRPRRPRLSIAETVVASSSAYRLKQVGAQCIAGTSCSGVPLRRARNRESVGPILGPSPAARPASKSRLPGDRAMAQICMYQNFFAGPGGEAARRRGRPEPRVAREKSGARPACGCTGGRSGGGAARREKLARALRRAGRRRATPLRRRGGATSGTRRPAGRACGAAGGAGAGGAARKPPGGEAERRPHRGALRAERPDLWGAATAGEKCGAKASTSGDFAAAVGGV